MKVLITGFDKFGNDTINPSEIAVNNLPEEINDIKIKKLILPTTFNSSFEILKEYIVDFKPNIVIHIGQAGGSRNIRVERVAINIDDARIADNNNNKPVDRTIEETGQSAYFSTLPIKAIVKNLNDNNIAAEVSNSAGTFVCNHIMYKSLHFVTTNFPETKSGFIHIPYIPEQTKLNNYPSMELEKIERALKIIIETSCTYFSKDDILYSNGKIY